MSATPTTGQAPFAFTHLPDLRAVPAAALEHEPQLHGCFAADPRPGFGQLYYGMPGLGVLRVSADLTQQDLIRLPADLTPHNFHSTRLGLLDGAPRLFLSANSEGLVAVVTLEGEVEFILPRPELEAYLDSETPFHPTDSVWDGERLFVADGYGAQYISTADLRARRWTGFFGGKTADPDHHHGLFGTAHGIARIPAGTHLAVADRPHSRIEIVTFDGAPAASYGLPAGSRPCGIDYVQHSGRWYAVVGSLDDPEPGRPAPIYILDAETYQVLSTLRPKEDLGLDRVDHLHNVVWHQHNGQLYLVCQAWNPGFYFVLALAG